MGNGIARLAPMLKKYKYPLIVLLLGLMLMLLPSGSDYQSTDEIEGRMQQVLSCTQGVGEARVIVSENGVVVVCSGAENARVRLDIIRAVSAYTGFGADRITVLKMAE